LISNNRHFVATVIKCSRYHYNSCQSLMSLFYLYRKMIFWNKLLINYWKYCLVLFIYYLFDIDHRVIILWSAEYSQYKNILLRSRNRKTCSLFPILALWEKWAHNSWKFRGTPSDISRPKRNKSFLYWSLKT
jgi:hypothetical protein